MKQNTKLMTIYDKNVQNNKTLQNILHQNCVKNNNYISINNITYIIINN